MGSFKRALLGYSRREVDGAIASWEARAWALERDAADAEGRRAAAAEALARAERELTALSAMVIDREREIRGLAERLREANERHERSIASLEAITARLEEIQAQARGQATRIRMKALRDAVAVSRRAQELSEVERQGVAAAPRSVDDAVAPSRAAAVGGAANGAAGAGDIPPGLFEGLVRVEIGPLADFSQLVGFEDAAGQIDGAAEISVERFSEGRATLAMRLEEPVDLLRELEERSPLGFRVRRTSGGNVVLDVDEEADGREAA